MARVKITSGNRPHQGHGHKSRPGRMKPLKASSHLAQRTNTGFDDRHGYKNTPNLRSGLMGAGKAPTVGRETGHYHPIHTRSPTRGYDFDAAETKRLQRKDHDERDQGYHTGREAKADTRRRDGPVGNSKGSPPPGVGSGKGVRGSPESHLGTAGRGGTGRMGKGDGYKGKPTKYSEDISHEAFEKLGAD